MPSCPSSLPGPLFVLAVIDLVFSLLLLLVVPLRCPCRKRSPYKVSLRFSCTFCRISSGWMLGIPVQAFPLTNPRKILDLLGSACVCLGLPGSAGSS